MGVACAARAVAHMGSWAGLWLPKASGQMWQSTVVINGNTTNGTHHVLTTVPSGGTTPLRLLVGLFSS